MKSLVMTTVTALCVALGGRALAAKTTVDVPGMSAPAAAPSPSNAPKQSEDLVTTFKGLEASIAFLLEEVQKSFQAPVHLASVYISKRTSAVLVIITCPQEHASLAFVVFRDDSGGNRWAPADFFTPFDYERAKSDLDPKGPGPHVDSSGGAYKKP